MPLEIWLCSTPLYYSLILLKITLHDIFFYLLEVWNVLIKARWKQGAAPAMGKQLWEKLMTHSSKKLLKWGDGGPGLNHFLHLNQIKLCTRGQNLESVSYLNFRLIIKTKVHLWLSSTKLINRATKDSKILTYEKEIRSNFQSSKVVP